jgi:hypothetical protein
LADLDAGWKRERRAGQRIQGIDNLPDAIDMEKRRSRPIYALAKKKKKKKNSAYHKHLAGSHQKCYP